MLNARQLLMVISSPIKLYKSQEQLAQIPQNISQPMVQPTNVPVPRDSRLGFSMLHCSGRAAGHVIWPWFLSNEIWLEILKSG